MLAVHNETHTIRLFRLILHFLLSFGCSFLSIYCPERLRFSCCVHISSLYQSIQTLYIFVTRKWLPNVAVSDIRRVNVHHIYPYFHFADWATLVKISYLQTTNKDNWLLIWNGSESIVTFSSSWSPCVSGAGHYSFFRSNLPERNFGKQIDIVCRVLTLKRNTPLEFVLRRRSC